MRDKTEKKKFLTLKTKKDEISSTTHLYKPLYIRTNNAPRQKKSKILLHTREKTSHHQA